MKVEESDPVEIDSGTDDRKTCGPTSLESVCPRIYVQQIAEAVQSAIAPRGVAVLTEARHFCMMMRGVEKQHSGAVTSTMLGAFRTSKATRDEFLALVSRP